MAQPRPRRSDDRRADRAPGAGQARRRPILHQPSTILQAAIGPEDRPRQLDSTRRGNGVGATATIAAALVLLIILLDFGFWQLLWVVLRGFWRLIWGLLLAFWQLPELIASVSFWLLLMVALRGVIKLIGLGKNAVDWVRGMPVGGNAPPTTRRGGEEGTGSATEELADLVEFKEFSYEELKIATNSFAEDLKLGEGGGGIVYKGHIGKASTPVAVKLIRYASRRGREEYISEVKSLSQLGHRNLVQLKGYCHERKKFVLVYEFMEQGSLENHLFRDSTTLLTWERRYNIARGLASVLHYLREECHRCVIHRDIKSSNVMLNEDFVAKLGDFGLAKLVDHTREPDTKHLKGTPGYWAPEYARMGILSKDSDIHGFGVVLLEIGSGRKAVDLERDPEHLVYWVWKQYECGKLLDAVDSKLGKNFDKRQAKALMMVGLWCANPNAGSRPSIEEATNVLNMKADPPKLPLKMPACC